MSIQLAYQSYGDPAAKTILFLHGGGVAGWMWAPVIARLPEYHCLVPDLPEHGQSLSVAPFTMPFAAAQGAALVREQAREGKATVVGLSEGAQTAVQMLASAPEVMERALISSALLLPMPGGWLYRSPALLRWLFRMSVPPFRNNEWWMRLNMKQAAAIPDEFFPQYKATFQSMTEGQFVNLLIANQDFRLPANLNQVRVPVLAVAGKHEYAVMKESARQLAAALPAAQARLIDLGPKGSLAVEHNWAMTAPDLFAQTVRALMEGKALPGALRPLA